MASQGSCAYVDDIQSVRQCGVCHLSVRERRLSLLGPNPALASHPLPPNHSSRRVACSTNHFRSFVAFLFLEVCLHGAFGNIVRLGSQVFPSIHAWPVDACIPQSPLCFDKFTIAAAQNPRKSLSAVSTSSPPNPPETSNGMSPVHD